MFDKHHTHGPKSAGSRSQQSPLLAAAQVPGVWSNPYTEVPTGSALSTPPRSPSPVIGASGYATPMSPSASGHGHGPRYGPTATASPAGSSLDHTTPVKGAAPVAAADLANDDGLDDYLHTFGPDEKKDLNAAFHLNSWRGWSNALTLFVLLGGFVVLFAGYPIIQFYQDKNLSSGAGMSGYNLGGVNASGQYPEIPGFPQLIDSDTPQSAYKRKGSDGVEWELVFSDEFNKDGRSFYPGDDPFFTAVDLHYWATVDFEWYHPSQVTTKDGNLVLSIAQIPMNNLMFRSGMVQSWNQLCFNKNAYFEVRASLPGTPKVGGFWPGIWTMGNLGRPGYGGTTEGMWPYSYSACDVGILPNQTRANGTPLTNKGGGDPRWDNGDLSYLPGQRLSSCPCPGNDDLPGGYHPGPPGVGRGSVEIDMIEAQTDQARGGVGVVSQSAQVAPFDLHFVWNNASGTSEIFNPDVTKYNDYLGGPFQQAISAVSDTCLDCENDAAQYYQDGGAEFAVYGYEFVAHFDDRSKGHIEWVNLGKPAWRVEAAGMGPNSKTEIDQRLIAEEPMALIFNLGMSNNFETVNFDNLKFPNQMLIDYIRVYQIPGSDGTIGCDPPDRPTAEYIKRYRQVYDNPNITTWSQAGYEFPKNTYGGC